MLDVIILTPISKRIDFIPNVNNKQTGVIFNRAIVLSATKKEIFSILVEIVETAVYNYMIDNRQFTEFYF